MNKLKKFFLYWLPVIVWMSIIFYFSSKQRLSITHKFIFDFLIFKTFHLIEYGFLYFLSFRALDYTSNLSLNKKMLYAFIIAIVYAISDEIHQLFVPTREGKARDVFIDAIGITVAFLCIKVLSNLKNMIET